MALTFSNPVNYATYAALNFTNVKLASGTRKDGTPYRLLTAVNKNTGAIIAIRIGNMTTDELKAKKQMLIMADATDSDTAETFLIVYLQGDRVEEDF